MKRRTRRRRKKPPAPTMNSFTSGFITGATMALMPIVEWIAKSPEIRDALKKKLPQKPEARRDDKKPARSGER